MANTRHDPELDLQGTFPRGGEVVHAARKPRRPLTGRVALQVAARAEHKEANHSELGTGRDLAGISDEKRLEGAANFRQIREELFGSKPGSVAVSTEVIVEQQQPDHDHQTQLPLE